MKNGFVRIKDQTGPTPIQNQAENINSTIRQSVKMRNRGTQTVKTLQRTVSSIKTGGAQSIKAAKALISAIAAGGWIVLVILIVVILFGAALSFLGSNSETYTPISEEVEAYDPLIRQYANEHGIGGGEIYWRWYGYDEYQPWCACFVSWCADQCGYIEAGIIPKFAKCSVGATWFQERGQFERAGYTPKPGDRCRMSSKIDPLFYLLLTHLSDCYVNC